MELKWENWELKNNENLNFLEMNKIICFFMLENEILWFCGWKYKKI